MKKKKVIKYEWINLKFDDKTHAKIKAIAQSKYLQTATYVKQVVLGHVRDIINEI